jgi:hypothetical protein
MMDNVKFFKQQERRIAPFVWIVAYLLSLAFVWLWPKESQGRWPERLIVLWTVGPPVWFYLEHFMARKKANADLPMVERFIYFQDLSAKFWVGAVFLLFYLHKGGL